jgi:L-fuculose-phosphate aldolase
VTTELRTEIVEVARRMNACGLNQGTSGNLSARLGAGLLVTPSAMPYEAMAASDIVAMDLDGTVHRAGQRPSSEWRIHADVLRARSGVGAIVHVHSPFATALSCLREGIPAFHYMVAVAGGDSIRCADYATFGTQALADHVLAALVDRQACLMANHGLIALGARPEDALALAIEVEALAAQYLRARQVGTPVLLDAEEMQRVLARFRDYRAQSVRK